MHANLKKLFWLTAVLVIGAGLYIYIDKQGEGGGEWAVVLSKGTKQEPDSDKDSLYDWQEELWGTDPHKADTDGDGTSDGKEVRDGRDPNRAGPNDDYYKPVESISIPSGEKYEYSFDPSLSANLTDKFAINLSSNYLLAKSNGVYNPSLGQSIIDRSIAELGVGELETSITLADLKTVGSGNQAAKDYMNNVAKILLSEKPVFGQEAIIINEVGSGNNLEDLSLLAEYEVVYAKTLSQLLATPVPTDLSPEHLSLLRARDTLVKSLTTIRTGLDTDPVATYVALSKYGVAQSTISNVYLDFAKYAKEHSLSFSSSDYAELYNP